MPARARLLNEARAQSATHRSSSRRGPPGQARCGPGPASPEDGSVPVPNRVLVLVQPTSASPGAANKGNTAADSVSCLACGHGLPTQ